MKFDGFFCYAFLYLNTSAKDRRTGKYLPLTHVNIVSTQRKKNHKKGPVSLGRPCILVYFGPPFIKIVFTAEPIVYTFNILYS